MHGRSLIQSEAKNPQLVS